MSNWGCVLLRCTRTTQLIPVFNALDSFLNTNLVLIVPVCGFTALSNKETCPLKGYNSPLGRTIIKVESDLMIGCCCSFSNLVICFSSTLKSIATGSSEEIVLSSVTPGETDVPGFTIDIPIVPEKGA